MTQVLQAREGVLTREMKAVAESEGVAESVVLDRVAVGRAVIPLNKKRAALGLPAVAPCGIGEGLRTKVNANIGASRDYASVEAELAKLKAAADAGADTVMDLSTGGDIRDIRQRILEASPVPIGTVPVYDAAVSATSKGGAVRDMTAEDIVGAVRAHAEQGVDFVTVHCGVTRAGLKALEDAPRVCGIVSRGGSFLANWMAAHGQENPLYERYDEILAIAREHDVTLSLGDGLRPGALADSMDRAQIHELNVLAGLCARARKAGVQVMIEGPGHVPLQQIPAQVRLEKALCDGAPFYVLGPLVTDVAPGYDHITAAIGGTVAAAAGVDFLCYVTATEHLGLPEPEHVREGVIVSRIAAHAGDIAKGLPGAEEWDRDFSQLRRKRNWPEQLRRCIDPLRAAAIRERRGSAAQDVCSMCSELCAFRIDDDTEKASRG